MTDPYDVEGLEKSLNDSATRVSTIWVSFLLFSLYLLTAATTVTHRQLLLAEPVKLPVLNIELPLWGFFFLAPILFLVFHIYVLLQVLLLGRTAAAYNQALERAMRSPRSQSVMRQRLANTLFAQIFAGSPREREGWLGWTLKAVAWTTLAIAPVLILVTFQLAFLAYQSHIATWTHRALIVAELVNMLLLWPLVLDSRRDFDWAHPTHVFRRIWRLVIFLPARLIRRFLGKPKNWPTRNPRSRHLGLPRTIRLAFLGGSTLAFLFLSLFVASFPGEPHINLLSGHSLFSAQCDRWIFAKFDRIDLRADRLIVPSVDVVDDEKLAKLMRATDEKGRAAYEGERTQTFRERSFRCAILSGADLRRTDFRSANLAGATLDEAELQGAIMDDADLSEASLRSTKLKEASLRRADLRQANLLGSDLTQATIDGAEFKGADLGAAEITGATGPGANFRGADLSYARLQGSSFWDVDFQGANLDQANLQSTILRRSKFQAAKMTGANLVAAQLAEAQMQGVVFDDDTKLDFANFENVFLWNATNAKCTNAKVTKPQLAPVIEGSRPTTDEPFHTVDATPAAVDAFINKVVQDAPASAQKELRELLNRRLRSNVTGSDMNGSAWTSCSNNTKSDEDYYRGLAHFIVRQACEESWNEYNGIDMIVTMEAMRETDDAPSYYTDTLVRGLLGIDQSDCQTKITLSDKTGALLARLHGRFGH